MRDQEAGFVVKIDLFEQTTVDMEDLGNTSPLASAAFVTELETDVEAIKRYAGERGWDVSITTSNALLCAARGLAEISMFIEGQDPIQTKNDPRDARMNRLERDLTSLTRQTRASFEELKQLITNAVQVGGSVRRVADEELQRAAYVEGARLTRSEIESVNHVPRQIAPRGTAEMNSSADPRSNSMAVVGVSARSTIVQVGDGIDEDGNPKLVGVPMPRVRDSLHKGTKLTE